MTTRSPQDLRFKSKLDSDVIRNSLFLGRSKFWRQLILARTLRGMAPGRSTQVSYKDNLVKMDVMWCKYGLLKLRRLVSARERVSKGSDVGRMLYLDLDAPISRSIHGPPFNGNRPGSWRMPSGCVHKSRTRCPTRRDADFPIHSKVQSVPPYSATRSELDSPRRPVSRSIRSLQDFRSILVPQAVIASGSIKYQVYGY